MYTHNNFNSIVSGLGNVRMSIYHDTTDVLSSNVGVQSIVACGETVTKDEMYKCRC
jgi:hypothetical protein